MRVGDVLWRSVLNNTYDVTVTVTTLTTGTLALYDRAAKETVHTESVPIVTDRHPEPGTRATWRLRAVRAEANLGGPK